MTQVCSADSDAASSGRATLAFSAAHGIPVTWIGGLPIAVINRSRSAELMVQLAMSRRGTGGPPPYITSANGQVLSMCARDGAIRALFTGADLIHADGTPLVFASRLRSLIALPERVATTDLFNDVAERAEQAGASFYLLGAMDDVIERAVEKTLERYPRLKIAGYRSGYFSRADEKDVVAQINAARPDILWIGMGAPAEQQFCIRNRMKLNSVGVLKTSGGLFDFVSGKNNRAPSWMQAFGLEWAYRMALEPRRLAYRYLTTNPHALYLLLTQSGRPAVTDKP
jgi:N-acetylglucosaminyldiphosphoundecaprenol N-acetyl-beta-D-mannosaminyltransferase